jgi:hypothetical protein
MAVGTPPWQGRSVSLWTWIRVDKKGRAQMHDTVHTLKERMLDNLGTDMPPPTSFGTKCTKASMRCFGNILCNENFSGNAVVRFMIERII